MDSLHPSLSQALPLRDYDAEQALQAPFRAAALGIATFYKKASENGRKAYSLGYSSALQDVLAHLQTALDQLDSPNSSQESMAITIQRVVDYIQRRQEALRAESQEPNEEEAAQPSPAGGGQGRRQSTTPPTHSTLSPPSEQAPAAPAAPDRSSSSSSSVPAPPEPNVTVAQTTRRRTSPRRMTPASFQPSQGALGFGSVLRQPSSSPSSTNNLSRHPFNLNFSSFAASPLPQHHQLSSSTGPTNTSSTTTTTSSLGRRHRNGLNESGRKGKLKERNTTERSSSASSLDPIGLFPPHGYSHYSSSPPNTNTTSNTNTTTASTTTHPSSSDDSKTTLTSIGNNKRRFPVDSPLDSSPLIGPPQPIQIHTTHHHHPGQDDVLMLLHHAGDHLVDDHDHPHSHQHQEPNTTTIERASKRFFSCKNLYS
ncbi:hypothetical protein PGT21_016377 [Puccinia graminis f. sp. tritici]|uniref:Uncharacterized protein n=1 Tax=Puccinia graminis f. sp. tritici TaxID=56615 RepID=A0A5B0PLB5_PUCGR|nr:hypothetical protein PGT21_016377 [Puccinia graminis f. sp. tritici]